MWIRTKISFGYFEVLILLKRLNITTLAEIQGLILCYLMQINKILNFKMVCDKFYILEFHQPRVGNIKILILSLIQ